MKRFAILVSAAVVLASCASARLAPPAPTTSPEAPTAAPTTAPTASPEATATPDPPQYAKLRVFVASENTDQVWVMEGAPGGEYAVTTKVPVGRMPHQMAVAPNGAFVAVNNRMSNTTSVIDPLTMKEIQRIPVGKQPHGITFSVDSRTLYVAHERDPYILAIDTATWKTTAFMVGVPQHVLTINVARPNEIWFTVTNSSEVDVLRVLDVTTKEITKVKVGDVHDAYFTPDGSEIWSSSSGFLDKPSDRMVIYDPATRKVKEEIHLTGHYPFHTLKPFQDGMYALRDPGLIVLSDHTFPGLMWVAWRERRVVSETKLGQQPFHSTYDPEGNRLLVTTNVDGMVNVIDLTTRQVVQKVPVSKPHGIVSVGIQAGQ